MTKLQKIVRRPLAAAALVALAAMLAACHHHDDEDDHKPPVGETPPPPPVAADAFVTYVSQQVAAQSDTAEPLSTDGVSATAPETSEPLPVPGV